MRRYTEAERIRVLDNALERLETIYELPPKEAWAVGSDLIEDCVWTSPFLEYTYGHSSPMLGFLARMVRKLDDPNSTAEAIAEAKEEYSTFLEKCFRHCCGRDRPTAETIPSSAANSESAHAA